MRGATPIARTNHQKLCQEHHPLHGGGRRENELARDPAFARARGGGEPDGPEAAGPVEESQIGEFKSEAANRAARLRLLLEIWRSPHNGRPRAATTRCTARSHGEGSLANE